MTLPSPSTASAASPLIGAQALHRRLASARPPVVLDVRWALATGPDAAAYAAGHIPGARFTDLDAHLAGPPGAGGRHPLPSAARFEESMRALGVRSGGGTADPASTVVVYDAGPATAAARAWWLLRHFGHADVLVLDGGLAAWTARGLPVEQGAPTAPPEPGDFRAGPAPAEDAGSVLEAGDALAFARRGVLIDARAAERFRGEVEPADPVAGHIPGAVNRPTGENVAADGTLLPAADLRRAFGALLDGRTEAAAYCGSGITAAHEVLALAVAGFPARLYPGSWSHWITDPARPVAVGED